MKNFNKFKAYLIKNIADRFNDRFYPYLPPQLPTQEQIDIMPSLSELEAKVYQDTLNRTDLDGIYHYRCHPLALAEKGERIPDLGDMALKQGCAIGAIALRIKHIGEGGVQFKTFDALLRGIELFVTEDGYLIRGKCRHIKVNGEWIFNFNDKFIYASDEGHPPVSGDQLAGFCFGLSLAYHLHPEKFPDSLKQKLLLFTDRMIANKMMLQERDGKTCKGEIPYNSWREQNGSAVTKLALLSLAYKISSENGGYEEDNKYFDWYWKLIDDYSFDSLAEYSSIFIGSWNNYFGTNISALSLFAIGLNMNFPDYVKNGLGRIAWQTRDYGYALFHLLFLYSYGKSTAWEYFIKSCLLSHFIPCGEDKFVRKIFFFGRKKRVSALSIRARNKEDFVFQRNPFDPPNNFNPDLWALGNTGSEDFLLEYWMAKYMEVI